jgi:hypothetical protein
MLVAPAGSVNAENVKNWLELESARTMYDESSSGVPIGSSMFSHLFVASGVPVQFEDAPMPVGTASGSTVPTQAPSRAGPLRE